jgi:hypothetical protein
MARQRLVTHVRQLRPGAICGSPEGPVACGLDVDLQPDLRLAGGPRHGWPRRRAK